MSQKSINQEFPSHNNLNGDSVLSFMNSITSLKAAYGFSEKPCHCRAINERVELDQNHFVFQSFSPKRPTAFKI